MHSLSSILHVGGASSSRAKIAAGAALSSAVAGIALSNDDAQEGRRTDRDGCGRRNNRYNREVDDHGTTFHRFNDGDDSSGGEARGGAGGHAAATTAMTTATAKAGFISAHNTGSDDPIVVGSATAGSMLRRVRTESVGGCGAAKMPPHEFRSLLEPLRCRCEGSTGRAQGQQRTTSVSTLARRRTIRRMKEAAAKVRLPLEERYEIHPFPLGEGAFGEVYSAIDRSTGEKVAVKKISKVHTNDTAFQREINALLRIQASGGHPNICGLRETFDENDGYYYLILDLVSGGEMFDHLINNGAYSEADAARLMREVAGALAHLHGIGVVHADLKPENLMLSTKKSSDAVIKLVDFGSAHIAGLFDDDGDDDFDEGFEDDDDDGFGGRRVHHHGGPMEEASMTPAYCPAEVIERTACGDPARDMWALGTILYIMLTGLHPFDLSGESPDDVIEELIKSRKAPPLDGSPITAHLSTSALDIIKRLLEVDPRRRITAHDMLDHPWVRGETARTDVIADSDKRLSTFRAFRSRLEAKVFADIVSWSDEDDDSAAVSKRASLIERAFQSFDTQKKGYLTPDDFRCRIGSSSEGGASHGGAEKPSTASSLSLSGFSDLLSENMRNKYFPRGHIIYKEGDLGNHMYFISSGTVEVSTKDGSRAKRGQGDFFGEGALLHPKKIRSATIRCVTPVHAIEISREYFEKYLASSDSGLLKLNLREKDKTRKRNRAKTILRLQNNLNEVHLSRGEPLFKMGDEGKSLYILEDGKIEVTVGDNTVFTMRRGDLCGEHSLVTGRPRNCTATCVSDRCTLHEMRARDFYTLLDSSPSLKETLREICLRREFQKALCNKLNKPFPSAKDLREAFDAIDEDKSGTISLNEVRNMLHLLDDSVPEDEIREVIQSLDLDESGVVSFQEFKRIFGMGESQAASI